MEIKHLLEDTSNRFSSKTAIVFKETEISFSRLKENVFRLANALADCGVKKSDKVAIYLPNCPEYIYSYLAIFCLGAVGVPLDFMLKEDELISCLSHSETKYLIAMPREGLALSLIKQSVSSLKTVILLQGQEPGMVSYQEIISKASAQPPKAQVNDSDLSLIMYTSGTTGKPKGILLNYKHLEGSPKAMEYFVDLTEKDVKLCALPLSHIAGLIYVQNCIIFGITLVLMDRFNPIEFMRNVERYKVTCFHVVPAMYMAFLSLKEIEKFNLSSLRWIVVFGAPSSPDILKRFHQYCPNAHFLNGWGMTETCPPNTVTPLGSDKIASVGKPSPHCEIKIFDEDDREVAAGEIGEIVIRGWTVMEGYYKDPEATNELKRNGWFHTGDLGRFDGEGFLFIVGRKKEMIKVGGQIVYAPEVEAALHKHEAVAEVAVIGVPDKVRGEAVKAFVVLKQKDSMTAEDLRYFAREHLAHFKVPHSIVIVEDLAKNRVGKIDKELLKQISEKDSVKEN
ncbi:MAG TPA: AMP-binding protein [Candidatus Omnitrophota bacterium]|nr:AMP-binding protein [Candidatus Omnitrophota bacterium]HPD85533.1 AMP-binding protein [Candidatus Omnitrophota bacterium]HRZ04427.1 AMP-binding protein [Candidatus Omnitrophota bacterium]